MNAMAIPCTMATGMAVGTFTNTETIFLLRNPEHFALSQEMTGQVANDIIFYSVIMMMVSTLCIGYVYELCGRKWTIVINALISGFFMFLVPLAPNLNWLIFFRMGMAFALVAPMCQPLVNDYVKKTSRGQAVAFQGLGLIIGDLFTFLVLFNIIKGMTYYESFSVATTFVVIMAVVILFLVKEPNMKKLHRQSASSSNVIVE